MANLSLDDIVNIKVEVSQMSAPSKGFNIGLIIGSSTTPELGKRVMTYASVAEMAEAGFSMDSPEYKAATLYFSQSPAPDVVAIGLKAADETPVQALAACRGAGVDWYTFTFTRELAATLTNEQIKEVAAYVEAEKTSTVWLNLVTDKDTYLATMQALKELKYSRTMTVYSTFEGTATAGVMGYAMGANYENSTAYTMALKTIVGITTEDLTSSELKEILSANGNVYVNQGTYYSVFRSGKMANGYSFDDVIYLDMLVNGIATSVMNQLTTLPKIPQTTEGVDILVAAIAEPCQKMVTKGYLAPGKWTGRKVLNLQPGDTLTQGYLILSESIADQSQADRDARKAPAIYVCIKTAGAIESMTIGVVVNR